MKGSLPTTSAPSLDEEALAEHVSAEERRERGTFFTPRALVDRVLASVGPFVPTEGRLRIIDPACGAGAFLSAAATRWPKAELVGLELNERSAQQCRARVPRAKIGVGDALTSELPLPDDDAFELWLGNPPYNGTSPLLRSKAAWATACAWLPSGFTLPRGTSLREDFLFFMLRASQRLERRRGALAFVTSATLLDTFAYAPVRQALLSRLQLREVIELERGTFQGTRVVPCVTTWTAAPTEERRAQLDLFGAPRPSERTRASPVTSGCARFTPEGPEWRFKPPALDAQRLEKAWRRHGAPLDQLVPVSFAGLKTRFDELLVDGDRARLEARVRAFLSAETLEGFAQAFDLTDFLPKLEQLKAFSAGAAFDRSCVRPFIRYRGPNPRGDDAWCYVERKLIPRGDHRLRGDFDPHAAPLKLVFNWRELPLAAHVVDQPGCVTMYRHSRFAPAMVPRALLQNLDAKDFDAQDLVPNLSERGRAFGSVREVFAQVARHVMSKPFQEIWAPAYGTLRVPVIPLKG